VEGYGFASNSPYRPSRSRGMGSGRSLSSGSPKARPGGPNDG